MLMLIYTRIIQPKFEYAITIWRYTCDNNIHNIQRLQNRTARIVTGVKIDETMLCYYLYEFFLSLIVLECFIMPNRIFYFVFYIMNINIYNLFYICTLACMGFVPENILIRIRNW